MNSMKFASGITAVIAAAAMGTAVIPAKADLPIPSATSGTVTKIEWGKQRFWIKNHHGETIRVNAGKKARYKLNGKYTTFNALKVGEQVRVFANAMDLNDKGIDARDVQIWGHYHRY